MNNNEIRYYTGLDLGQTGEFTALAVLEQQTGPDPVYPSRTGKNYAVRHLERFAMGASFPEICQRLTRLFAEAPLRSSNLVVDYTAVGRPVLKLIRRARLRACIRPITITGGYEATVHDNGVWSAPKRDLVANLQVLLQARRLKVAPTLPESQTLVRELTNYQVKVPLSNNDTLESWRERPHDDLVLAVAIAAWLGEQLRDFWIA
jgi:hypothetical protein